MPVITFGIDVSHHQGALNFPALRREGVQFAFIKATEGDSFRDPNFTTNLNGASASGMLVAAYHYVRSNATAAAQVANVVRTVPKNVPVIPDVEANSGDIKLLRDFVAQLEKAGYRVPLTYLPRWYWQQIGSPSLVGLPSLWSSRYPDNIQGSLTDEYAKVPAIYWNGYGNLGVTVLQFTSSASIAGKVPLDANAYLGTINDLAAVLNGADSDMEASDLVIDPATGQPALDINGNSYTYNQAWYYTNLSAWVIRDGVEALKVQLAALAGTLSAADANILAAIKLVTTPTLELTPEDIQRFADSVMAEVDPSVQDAVRQAFARAGAQPETPDTQ
jgi:GH25 family lysozyme M1 (1,4-beta-N-acetylmuramidase)